MELPGSLELPGSWSSDTKVKSPAWASKTLMAHVSCRMRQRGAFRELGAPGKVEHVGHPCGVTPQARRRGLGSGGAQVARVVQRNQGETTCLGLKDIDGTGVLGQAPESIIAQPEDAQ